MLNHPDSRAIGSHNIESIIRRLTENREVVGKCWYWTGYRNQHGYGRMLIAVRPKVYRLLAVHRLSFELHKGPIPDGLDVLHKCDNRPCFNPECLFPGTQLDNMHDMIAKGRYRNGRLVHGRYMKAPPSPGRAP